MKTCITLHPHEIARCPGPVTLLRPMAIQPKRIDAVYPDGSIETERIFRDGSPRIVCPYGRVGDVLAVRETWRNEYWMGICVGIGYRDGMSRPPRPEHDVRVIKVGYWQSPVTMPAALARYQFTVEGVDVKRVQSIAGAEWRANGWYKFVKELSWNRRYPRHPWASNPMLWLIRGNVEVKR
jgi:hypothetical protein